MYEVRSPNRWLFICGLRWPALVMAAASAVLVSMSGCSRPSDEQQIRAALAEMQSAMEAGDPAGFMHYIAEDFVGGSGDFDRAALHNLLRAQVLANSRISVGLGLVEIELHEDRATVELSVTLLGGSGRWLPERGSVHRISSGWRRQGGEWQCISARWERSL